MADTSASDTTPAAKRRRVDGVDDSSPSATGPSEKYKDMWLEDGNVIIQCPQGAFRVHRSLLATQSEVFRDMFTLPIPESGAGDAVPTVQLSDDTDQMYMFLRCLILHEYPSKTAPSKQYMNQILDMLELSRKYVVPVMRTACVNILKELFPDTLQGYQLTIQRRRDLVTFQASLRCVVVATTYGLPTLLPSCYLYIAGEYYEEMMYLKKASTWPADIPLTYYATIVRSMTALSHLKQEMIHDFSDDWRSKWEYGEHTGKHGHEFAGLLGYSLGPNNGGMPPTEDLILFDPNWTATDVVHEIGVDELCEECIGRWDNAQRMAWMTAWRELPRYLSLDSWTAIHQRESQALSAATA
ncbi:unnamed protein product [Peniophora sp. CBMAI 1063]|nr:unnamed protein product [Peniophora sp. CBMAI 1063]